MNHTMNHLFTTPKTGTFHATCHATWKLLCLLLSVSVSCGGWALPTAQAQTGATPSAVAAAPLSSAKIAVYFSPGGGAQEAVIREVDGAKGSILIQAYSFTSAPIAKALLDAQKRGVKVEAVLDKSNETATYTSATFLQNAGAKVLIDFKPAIAHSKIMLIDLGTPTATLLTGSFNFTKAAQERNAENLLVIKEAPDLFKSYEANFRARATLSRPYARTKPVGGVAPDATSPDATPPDAEDDEVVAVTAVVPVPATAGAKTPTAATPTATPTVTPTVTPVVTPATAGALLNLNSATAKDLENLPGIGKVSAERILEYRAAKGAVKSVDELGQVKGIGKATLDKLRPLVTVK